MGSRWLWRVSALPQLDVNHRVCAPTVRASAASGRCLFEPQCWQRFGRGSAVPAAERAVSCLAPHPVVNSSPEALIIRPWSTLAAWFSWRVSEQLAHGPHVIRKSRSHERSRRAPVPFCQLLMSFNERDFIYFAFCTYYLPDLDSIYDIYG